VRVARPANGLFFVLFALTWLFAPAARGQWEVRLLHPPGAAQSQCLSTTDTQQAGLVYPDIFSRASIWSGSAATYIDLHTSAGGAMDSWLNVTDGTTQGGYLGFIHNFIATLWTGSPQSATSLHPQAATIVSSINDISGDEQVGHATIGSDLHAGLWRGSAASFVDLNPPGSTESQAFGTSGTEQVGFARFTERHAVIWQGSPSPVTDLHPAGAIRSVARDTNGTAQVGSVQFVSNVALAALWTGSTASYVDLNPPGAVRSEALAISGDRQAGYADFGNGNRAGYWTGSGASFVSLHQFLPARFGSSIARDIYVTASGVWMGGTAFNTQAGRNEAVLWVNTLCYADCDQSTGPGVLDVFDFLCFQNSFVSGEPYACDCDTTTGPLVCDVFDFLCFQDAFVVGCQ
jgi:hypothetical protein